MNFNPERIKQIVLLRASVGLLGEQARDRWWTSTFCEVNSRAFLSPVFPCTHILAQLRGVSAAAALVHDDHIGVGNAFHLFRLPEYIEQGVHDAICGPILQETGEILRSTDSAMQFIESSVRHACKDAVGPVRVGACSSLGEASVWCDLAAFYLSAFEGNGKTFPFFSDRS